MANYIIKRLKVTNYRALKRGDFHFNDGVNIIVGDNEAGKSTLLECITLALSGQINGRSALSELHPMLFNIEVIQEYIDQISSGARVVPPSITIEVFFQDVPELAALRGTNNTEGDNCPGVTFDFEFDNDFATEYGEYISRPAEVRSIPIEYYKVQWLSFAFNSVTSRSIPVTPVTVDASRVVSIFGASKYVSDLVRTLPVSERVNLSLSYRRMKDAFLSDDTVKKINTKLAGKKGDISDKVMSMSLDSSARGGWEGSIMPHLDDVPVSLVGKGEQNSVKIKLALENNSDAHILLVEEPENHLSYSRLNGLIERITQKAAGRQSFITTHSSFVLNKLGINNVLLFNGTTTLSLRSLTPSTYEYFKKLPGHDTLRLILSRRAILVEGPSDELLVQKAFKTIHGASPLERGVDVISVRGLAFLRFLEIAAKIDRRVDVVTDNDKDVAKVHAKYADYRGNANIRINVDPDNAFPTLEPQLLKWNNLATLNAILGTTFATDADLVDYMTKPNNKTDVALKLFDTNTPFTIPQYILNAVNE